MGDGGTDTDGESATTADVEEAEHAGVDAAAAGRLEAGEDLTGALFGGAGHAAGGQGLAQRFVAVVAD